MWSLEIIQYHLKTPLLFYLLTGAQLLTMINQQKVLIVISKFRQSRKTVIKET